MRRSTVTPHRLSLMKRGVQWTGWIGSACVAVIVAGTLAWLLNKPPTVDCNAETATDHRAHKILARKVVVHPWLGPHHVYGVFMVPNRYEQNKKGAVVMTIRGYRYLAAGRSFGAQSVDGLVAEPGHYVLRSHVHTRVALWFLVSGLFGDLRRPCNWALVFIE